MKRTARINRLLSTAALAALVLSAPACTGEPGGALDEACETHADCPNPARQRCVPEWGVCVGQTNELGELDDPDGGAD